MEHLEIKFSKDTLFKLISKLQSLRELSFENGLSEPDMGLFIVKQSYVTGGVPIQMRLIWPEAR